MRALHFVAFWNLEPMTALELDGQPRVAMVIGFAEEERAMRMGFKQTGWPPPGGVYEDVQREDSCGDTPGQSLR
jgi:hypothetical protein